MEIDKVFFYLLLDCFFFIHYASVLFFSVEWYLFITISTMEFLKDILELFKHFYVASLEIAVDLNIVFLLNFNWYLFGS